MMIKNMLKLVGKTAMIATTAVVAVEVWNRYRESLVLSMLGRFGDVLGMSDYSEANAQRAAEAEARARAIFEGEGAR